MVKPILQETIIYGGAFNPPTRAHQAILQACVEYAEPRNADVRLLPSASRIDKAIEVGRAERLGYCDALARDVVRRSVQLNVETIELDRTQLTETYDTVQELNATYPERAFTWVFGSDSVASMGSWDHGQWLQENLSVLVINRPGAALPATHTQVTELPVDAGAYSSTELRQRLSAGQEYNDLVSPEVARLLAANAMLRAC